MYKAHMGKAIIYHTLTVIVVLYSCMVTTCTCICTGECLTTQDPLQYIDTKNLAFLAQGIYHLQYKHPAMPLFIVVYTTYIAIYMY